MRMKNSITGLKHFKNKTPPILKKKGFLILKNSLLLTNLPRKNQLKRPQKLKCRVKTFLNQSHLRSK